MLLVAHYEVSVARHLAGPACLPALQVSTSTTTLPTYLGTLPTYSVPKIKKEGSYRPKWSRERISGTSPWFMDCSCSVLPFVGARACISYVCTGLSLTPCSSTSTTQFFHISAIVDSSAQPVMVVVIPDRESRSATYSPLFTTTTTAS